MFFDCKQLSWPSREHDLQSIEDAAAVHPGAFVVADGAGSTYRSGEWARALVQYCIEMPLASNDRFEVRWWLERVQALYQQQLPPVSAQDWKEQHKALEGGAATLAALTITSVHAGRVRARFLAIGDSCIFHSFANTRTVQAFPLHDETDFQRDPFCFPSVPGEFYSIANQIHTQNVEIQPGDRILIVTDAVARWLLTHTGKGRWEAFNVLASMNKKTLPSFLRGCREDNLIADDDVTIVALSFSREKTGSKLETKPILPQPVFEERQRLLLQALQNGNKEDLAIYYGDGSAFRKSALALPSERIRDARQVALAIDDIRRVYVNFCLFPETVPPAAVEQAWRQYEDLLCRCENRVSAAPLLSILQERDLLKNVALPDAGSTLMGDRGSWRPFWRWLRSVKALLRGDTVC